MARKTPPPSEGGSDPNTDGRHPRTQRAHSDRSATTRRVVQFSPPPVREGSEADGERRVGVDEAGRLGAAASGGDRAGAGLEEAGILATLPKRSRKCKPPPRSLLRGVHGKGLKLQTWPGRAAISRATRYIDGGRERFLEYVQLAVQEGDDTAIGFWDVYSSLKGYEQYDVSFDDVLAASGGSPSALMAAVVSAGMNHEKDLGEVVAASLHPSLVHKTGKSAMRIGGKNADIAQKDRFALLQHAGFMPVPRNATMNVNVNANASANSKAAAAASSEPSVPSFMDDVVQLRAPREQIQKELIGKVVDAEVVKAIEW